MPHVKRFSTPHVDLTKLVKGAPAFYEYPMADRDPLPRWTHGRVTLLGDAAHPMYPVGSNGASQAILDARCLADLLAAASMPAHALAAYEADRLPKTAEIVRNNRKGGPEGVIDEVERRAPDGFERHRRRAEPRRARGDREGLRAARRLRQGAGEPRAGTARARLANRAYAAPGASQGAIRPPPAGILAAPQLCRSSAAFYRESPVCPHAGNSDRGKTAMPVKFDAARFTAEEALLFHSQGKPGKLEITPTKPLTTQRDLSLAYSPGVAVPVLAIAQDPQLAYDYTNKGNLVAVVSNGTAILGLGNLGALAAKPVMEGKGALFKRFADIDGIDLLVDTPDVDAVINCVRYLGPSFGGINLEDIKAPDCFIIEEKLKELLNIPVFHDDQHGTAIIAAAGLINALELTGRDIKNFKLVVNGAGAASIACMDLLASHGHAQEEHAAVRHQGRDLPRPQGRHEPVEVGLRGGDQGAHAGGRAEGRRRLLRPLGRRHRRARTWCVDGGQADHLRHGQSRSGDHAGGGGRGALGRHRRHRALGLPQPDQQRAGLPLHLPRRARRAGLHHQRGHEDRRRQGAGRTGARGRARPGGGGLPRPAGEVRARLHHPGAVRSPAHHARAARRSPRRPWRPAWRAGRSSTWTATSRSSRPGSIRSRAGSAASSPRCAIRPSASSSPKASSRRSRAPPTPSTTSASASRC